MKQWFSNLKIGKKVTYGFLLVAIIAGMIGVIGVVSLNSVGGAYSVAYADSVTALESLERVSASFQEMRTDLFVIALAPGREGKESGIEGLKRHQGIIEENLTEYKACLEKYKAHEVAEELKLIAAIEEVLAEFGAGSEKFVSNPAIMGQGGAAEAYLILEDGGEIYNSAQKMEEAIDNLVKYNENYAKQQIASNGRLAIITEIVMIIGVLIGVLVAVSVGLYIARGISKRIGQIVEAAGRLSEGDLNVKVEVNSEDETGVLAQTFQHMAVTLKSIIADLTYVLEGMADGDFTMGSKAEESYVGDYSSLLESVQQMERTLSGTLRHINSVANQVSSGSDQVADGAQALASGATEQAASIEELTANVERIADQAIENTATVKGSLIHVERTGADVNAGNVHMGQLAKAMEDIDSASHQIADITKVIEDIVFQTNILALNAAIEAARAGEAGKGFAVVADEVRTLAAKSAEAARQAGELVQASVDAAGRGKEITAETEKILKDVGASAEKVIESFRQIEASSIEQSESIEQIKQGLSQVSAVIQNNAATAEENSAASEEITAQASMLRGEVEKFRLA